MNLKNPVSTALCSIVIALAAAGLSTSAMAKPFVLAYTDGQNPQSFSNLRNFYTNLDAVGLGSRYALKANGSVLDEGKNTTNDDIVRFANEKRLPVYPTVSDWSNEKSEFDRVVSDTILSSEANRTNAIANLLSLTINGNYAGINIDLEAVQPPMKAHLSTFIAALSNALHAKGKKLIISVPPMSGDGAPSYMAGYDYKALGAAVDYFQVMTYDEAGPGWSSSSSGTWPGPQAGLDWMNAKLSYAVSRVPANKVLQGLPTYGYDYSTGKISYWKGSNGVLGYNDILKAHPTAKPSRDSAAATPYAAWGTVKQQTSGVEWSNSTKQPVLWYDDVQSITAKTALVNTYKLGGTSIWAMGYEDAAFWDAVSAGLGVQPPAPPESPDGNIAVAGKGYIWNANASATANTNSALAPAVNDGNLSTTLMLNNNGEGGAQKWQAAGVMFSSAKSVTSAVFVNGALDSYGNGYFESGLSLQYTLNGSTWVESGWSVTPAYPNNASASSVAYTFSGKTISGVVGVRVSGRAGPSSWSGSFKEVKVFGK
ncbi:glycosyl hydrolase family 18 protein [Janthinobacterium sp. LB3P118]|uniref:glycosyl hydrolase family 18 protein n=1 Tax=Janthinobacterium sp. LB3P118 TaxID=3424195 RepID=UPI003F204678